MSGIGRITFSIPLAGRSPPAATGFLVRYSPLCFGSARFLGALVKHRSRQITQRASSACQTRRLSQPVRP